MEKIYYLCMRIGVIIRIMKHHITLYILLTAAILTIMAGCSKDNGTRRDPQPQDTLYTEERAMNVYAEDLPQALMIIDSAKIVGNLTQERADMLRATAYSRTLNTPCHDSAIVISERLLINKTAKNDPALLQNILEILSYSARQLEDYEMQLVYSTQLVDAYSQQGYHVEKLRAEAEVGAVLYRLGKTDEGLAKLDSVIHTLSPVRKFNELDASIIAIKRKISVIRDYPQIVAEAQLMLSRLEDYEQHPDDFEDGSMREPAEASRPKYIAFYRAQAWAYLAAAYAHMGDTQKARDYLTMAQKSDFGQTLSGKKMIAPTLLLLGDHQQMEAIYQELESFFVERGDTLTLDYAQLLLDRAKAAESQGRYKESNTLWERHAYIVQKAEERMLRSKANLYAARYHAQEQQIAINRQQAEIERTNIINAVLIFGIILLLGLIVYGVHLLHVFKRKNDVLAREISSAIEYHDKYQALTTPSESPTEPEPEPDNLASLSDEQLFQYISKVVMRDQLFLDPNFNRQKLTEALSLSKERVGAAFSKGSPFKSVTDYINYCRLPYAAKLLSERPDLSITEVAEASGYARAATFTDNFKKKFTLTPAQYRESLSAN